MRIPRVLAAVGVFGVFAVRQSMPIAQQASPPAVVLPIEPPAVGLPPEPASAAVTKFSFIAYGDTRGQADGQELQREHGLVVDSMLASVKTQAEAGFPVRFIVQSGDAVLSGRDATQWNVSFTPIIERLTREGAVPYFFAVGNHDVGRGPVGDSQRELGLRNTFSAMSKLWPPEGSPRRLNDYPTYAFGYGHMFVVAIDSNIASDATQLAWVARQLDALDRTRYRHVVAVFHHPPLSSGPHSGPVLEPQADAIRRLYLPLFRRHHVRMTIAGHDHLFDHWVEHYDDSTGTYRLDHLVTGGGGAPIYTYNGEPDLTLYAAAAAPQQVRLDHPIKPGPTAADNPHHFVIVEVDGDRIWLEVIGTGPRPFRPYGRPRIELSDRQG